VEKFSIGLLKISLYLPECHSLKEKRKIILSIKTKLKNNLNISFAEINDFDLWQKTTIAIASVAREKNSIMKTFNEILNEITHEKNVLISKKEIEFF
jgi:hypothetical protein